MSLLFYLYGMTDINRFGKYRGFWRIRKIIQNNIFTRNKYYRIPYLGHSVYVCPNHFMERKIFEGGIYEPAVIRSIQTFVKNGYSFIDIGANIGLHSLAAAFARVNNDQVFVSFEPNHDMFMILEKNCAGNRLKFVECREEGIGGTDACLSLHVPITNNKGKSSFLPLENTIPSHLIKVSTLDTLFFNDEKLASKNVLIKIDTEGYELPIIRGGNRWLSRIENSAIICEVSPSMMKQNGMMADDLFTVLKGYGFDQYAIYKDEETAKDLSTNSDQYNAIFYKGAFTKKLFSSIESEI